MDFAVSHLQLQRRHERRSATVSHAAQAEYSARGQSSPVQPLMKSTAD
jgi:hypothetical protein